MAMVVVVQVDRCDDNDDGNDDKTNYREIKLESEKTRRKRSGVWRTNRREKERCKLGQTATSRSRHAEPYRLRIMLLFPLFLVSRFSFLYFFFLTLFSFPLAFLLFFLFSFSFFPSSFLSFFSVFYLHILSLSHIEFRNLMFHLCQTFLFVS